MKRLSYIIYIGVFVDGCAIFFSIRTFLNNVKLAKKRFKIFQSIL